MSETKTEKKSKENIKYGGVFSISTHDFETMSAEFTEINNIIALAKADDGIKKILFSEILREFGDELLSLIEQKTAITDEKLETLINCITDTVNDNIQIEGCHNESGNISAYGSIPDKEKMKAWMKKILIGDLKK